MSAPSGPQRCAPGGRAYSFWHMRTRDALPSARAAFFIATIVLAVELEKDDDSVLGGPGSVLLSESGSSRDGYGTVAELFPSSGFWTESIPDVPAPSECSA